MTNFAIKGYESRHNVKYWTGEDYIGFGLSAHSYIDGERFANPSSFEEYYKCQKLAKERLTVEQKIEEHIMLGLRCYKGASVSHLKSLGYDIMQNPNVQYFLENNVRIQKDDSICLTPEFYGVSNYVIVKLLP